MVIEGVDFANERPNGAALGGAGKHFVIRYLSPGTKANPGKRITPSEITGYRAAGLDIGVVWETTTSRARAGRSAGVTDAHLAEAVRLSLGIPAIPIFLAVDEDVAGSAVADYFAGAASVLGVARTGVYGSYRVVGYLLDHKLVRYAWQTYAWSGGRWDDRAQVQQYHNGAQVAGMSLDLCRAMVAEWGQWHAPTPPAHISEEDMQLTDPIRLVKASDVKYSSPDSTVGGVLASTNYYVLQTRNLVTAQLAAITKLLDPHALAAELASLLPAGQTVDAAAIEAGMDAWLSKLAVASTADDTTAS